MASTSPSPSVNATSLPKLSHSASRGSTITDSTRSASKPFNNSKPLRYARPQDLPSHPIVGVDLSASGAAALLSKNARYKEMWKPAGPSTNASTAATLAHASPKSPELWKPDPQSTAHLAAILQRDPKYTITSATGSTSHSSSSSTRPSRMSTVAAQTQLSRGSSGKRTPPLSPRIDALDAGKHAMANQPPSSMPPSYTELHRQLSRGGAVPPSPPSELVDSNAAGAAGAALNRSGSRQVYAESTGLPTTQVRNLATLEEAAKRAASDRISKIGIAQPSYVLPPSAHAPAHRPVTALSGAESASRRVQLEHQEKLDRERNARENEKYDAATRYEILLTAAQRNVHASLGKIDKKLAETHLFGNKELNAMALAAAEQEVRGKHTANIDKVHIGNGVYMTMEEVHAIAQRHVQPVLDELSERALEHREQDELDRQERERIKAEKAEEKARIKAEKAEKKAERDAEKKAQKEVRDKEKAEKKAEKERQKEEKRRLKEEERLQKEEEKREREANLFRLADEALAAKAAALEEVHANAAAEAEAVHGAAIAEAKTAGIAAAKAAAEAETAEAGPSGVEAEESEAVKEAGVIAIDSPSAPATDGLDASASVEAIKSVDAIVPPSETTTSEIQPLELANTTEVAESFETEPVETEPIETEPVETKPVDIETAGTPVEDRAEPILNGVESDADASATTMPLDIETAGTPIQDREDPVSTSAIDGLTVVPAVVTAEETVVYAEPESVSELTDPETTATDPEISDSVVGVDAHEDSIPDPADVKVPTALANGVY